MNAPERAIFEAERPRRLAEIVGNQEAKTLAAALLASGAYRPGFLITGSIGTGKSTIASIIARTIVCSNPVGLDPCDACDPCSRSARGTALWGEGITYRNCADYDLPRLKRDLEDAYYAHDRPMVLVLDEFQRATARLNDLLLTRLEDEGAHFVLMILTADRHAIDIALAQRLFVLEMQPPSFGEMFQHLRGIALRRGYAVADSELESICDDCRNIPRACLNALHIAATKKVVRL